MPSGQVDPKPLKSPKAAFSAKDYQLKQKLGYNVRRRELCSKYERKGFILVFQANMSDEEDEPVFIPKGAKLSKNTGREDQKKLITETDKVRNVLGLVAD